MALSEGVMAFDTAPADGDAEKFLGKVLRRWRGERPFVSTKVGRVRGKSSSGAHYDYTSAGMRQSLLRSLNNLGGDHVSVVFLHDPARAPASERERLWEDLLSFREEGLAERVGLSGTLDSYWQSQLKKGKVNALMEYNNLSAVNISALHNTVPICRREQIERFQAASLHSELLGKNFKTFFKKRPEWIGEDEMPQIARLFSIAFKYDIPVDQLALRFLLSVEEVHTVVVDPSDSGELASSIEAWKAGSLPRARFYEICNGLT
jgi:aryl-alcohol dehydrogenase-like predicted oxidoreductase